MDYSWRNQTGGYLRAILTAKTYEVAVETPLQKAEKLSQQLGSDLYLKREDLQPVRSFKLRGAYNKMAHLSPEELRRGVITASAGNHAQGVAMSARALGCEAIICMPTSTPSIKVDAVRALGGTVELVGANFDETNAHALRRASSEGRAFIPPFDDPLVIAGQGTIGSEILRQAPGGAPDAVFVALGGGGLAAGVAAYIKALRPSTQVFGVESAGSPCMAASLARGERVSLTRVDAFADGIAVKVPGKETFRLCKELLDGIVLVDNRAMSAAIRDVFNESRCILEPSGAAAVAGATAWMKTHGRGLNVVAVTSGANVDFQRLRAVSEMADAAGRETMLATRIPETPGSFLRFLDCALPRGGVAVTEFKYRLSDPEQAYILFSIAVAPGSQDARDVVARLNDNDMPTLDLTDLQEAQTHLRHLVGGHARSHRDDDFEERIFLVDFPEYDGTLREFLAAISPRWSLTLFHYRQTGNISSSVLVGLDVPRTDRAALDAAFAGLSRKFTFVELCGRARHAFDMFIN